MTGTTSHACIRVWSGTAGRALPGIMISAMTQVLTAKHGACSAREDSCVLLGVSANEGMEMRCAGLLPGLKQSFPGDHGGRLQWRERSLFGRVVRQGREAKDARSDWPRGAGVSRWL